jgi:hypothetical protein
VTQPQKKQDPRVAQTAAAALGAAAITQSTAAATTAVIQMLWRGINPYSHGEVSGFAAQAGRIMVSSQRTVANAHVAAQQLQLKAVGVNQPVTVTIPDNVRGATVDFSGKTPKVSAPKETTIEYKEPKPVEVPLKEPVEEAPNAPAVHEESVSHKESEPAKLFERAAEKYRYERSVGKDHAAANDLAEQKITDLVDTNLLLSARLAQQQTLKLVQDQDARVIGYRRIIHPELSKGGVCGMCVAAADRVYKVDELRPIHARCQCTVSSVTSEHDPGFTLNQDDLDRLYDHAAEAAPGARSTSAAALKRPRYKIHHHHEYGPVLTKVTGEKLPYWSTTPSAA